MNSFVSIIVPCYNQAQYLDECLQSVLEQTHENWECIIVNDGSPDDTEVVAKKWLEKDSRFNYLCKENGGLSSARNAGISKAIGEFILPLDADDKIAPNYCELAIKEFSNKKNLKVVYCEAMCFGESNGIWNLPPYSLDLLVLENMIFCSAIYKRSEWERVGGYDEKMIYGLEDWEFWISILKTGGEVYKLDYLGFYYRTKKSSMAIDITNEQRKWSQTYVTSKHLHFIRANYLKVLEQNKIIEINLKSIENRFNNKKKLIKKIVNLILKKDIFKEV